MIIRAALYAHSLDSSLNDQIMTVGHFADEQRIHIVGTYADFGMYQTVDERPQFQRMIVDAKLGYFNVILVERVDRLSSNRYDHIWYRRKLRSCGVSLRFVDPACVSGPASMIEESIAEGIMEYVERQYDLIAHRQLRPDRSDAP